MRPTPAETIAGIRTILRDVVEPEVASEHARSRLREIRAVLAQVDWDDAALHLRRRVETVRGLLDEVAAWIDTVIDAGIDTGPDRAATLAGLGARIAAPPAPAETFAELNAAYAAGAALLVEAGAALAADPDGSGRALRDRVLRGLAEP